MRVLHLIDPDSPDGGPCTLRLLADVMRRLGAIEHRVLVIGGQRCAELATRCGVDFMGGFCPPRALPWGGTRELQSVIAALGAAGKSCDLIHAWTIRCAGLTQRVSRRSLPWLATFHVGPKNNVANKLAIRCLQRGEQPLLAASMAVRRGYRACGIDHSRLTLMPPAVDSATDHWADRAAVRARIAEAAEAVVDDDTLLVGVIGEPAEWTDAYLSATVAARVALSGRRVVLVVHENAIGRMNAARLLRDIALPTLMIADASLAEPWRIVRGLDAVLSPGSGQRERPATSVLPLLWAMAAGVPVVSERSESMSELIDDGVNGLLFDPMDVNTAADRLARLYDDRALARRIGDNGRALVSDMFNIEEYTVRLKHAYDLLLAGRAVQTVEHSPGMAEFHADSPVAA